MPEFETTAQGSRVATSVGGVLTGRGADLIVIDDPLKPEEALSQTQRQAANEWYDHTLYSRLNDKLTGAIVLILPCRPSHEGGWRDDWDLAERIECEQIAVAGHDQVCVAIDRQLEEFVVRRIAACGDPLSKS